jgi:hypothetical protein
VWLLPEDPLADVLEEPEDGVALEGIVARGEVVERHPAGPHVQLLTGEFFRSARHLSSQPDKLSVSVADLASFTVFYVTVFRMRIRILKFLGIPDSDMDPAREIRPLL